MKYIFPVHVPQDVGDSLRKGGVSLEDIQTIILSHIHWDQYVFGRTFSDLSSYTIFAASAILPTSQMRDLLSRKGLAPS